MKNSHTQDAIRKANGLVVAGQAVAAEMRGDLKMSADLTARARSLLGLPDVPRRPFNNFHICIRAIGPTPLIWDRKSRRFVHEAALTPETLERCTYPTVSGSFKAFRRMINTLPEGYQLEAGQLHLTKMPR